MINVDELAQEIRRVDGNHDKGAGALAEALMPFLERSISASPAGVVKPLEWKEESPGTHMLVAASAFGVYYAWEINGKGVWSIGASPGTLAGEGIEAAKSAAFADCSARIMSAIEPAGVGVETARTFQIGDMVRKRSGSWWEGRVVGFYSTEQTPDGVCVQVDKPMGPVQIYPASALAALKGDEQ